MKDICLCLSVSYETSTTKGSLCVKNSSFKNCENALRSEGLTHRKEKVEV